MNDWGSWSQCSNSCNGGESRRYRTPLYMPAFGGVQCGTTIEVMSCNEGPCAVHCGVSAWAPWGACSVSCGGGSHKRTRVVTTKAEHGGYVCPFLEESAPCNEDACPEDCAVGEWTSWLACSATCGGGYKPRSRPIVATAAHGGAICPQTEQMATCASFS